MLPTPFSLSTDQRQKRHKPTPVETEPHNIHTIPLARDHCDSYLNYFWYKTIEITPSQTPFQIICKPNHSINTGTYYRTTHPKI